MRDSGTWHGMRLRLLCLMLWLGIAGTWPVEGQSAGSAGDNAQVPVLFNSKAGTLVQIPAKDDVRLRFGGKPATIEQLLSLETMPLYFSMVVDISGSTRDIANSQDTAGLRFFEELAKGTNHGHLVLFNGKISASDRFLTIEEVRKVLKEFPITSRIGPTALYDAIEAAIDRQLASADIPHNSRRAIVILSDGEDNNSHLSLDQVIKKAQGAKIPIFAVGFWTGGEPLRDKSRSAKQGAHAIERICEETGGLVLDVTKPNQAEQLGELLRTQTVIQFDAPELNGGKSYPLKFETSRKEIQIMAPKDYIAPAKNH